MYRMKVASWNKWQAVGPALLFLKSKLFRSNETKRKLFCVLLALQFITFFVNNQHDAQLFILYLFIPILCMIRATKCSSTGVSIVPIRWYAGLDGTSKPAYHTVAYIQWHIPEVVLIQLTPLMMRTWLLETCRELE